MLRLWNPDSLEMIWEQPYGSLIAVAFDPDGSRLAVARVRHW
jgi:hypothetical protein